MANKEIKDLSYFFKVDKDNYVSRLPFFTYYRLKNLGIEELLDMDFDKIKEKVLYYQFLATPEDFETYKTMPDTDYMPGFYHNPQVYDGKQKIVTLDMIEKVRDIIKLPLTCDEYDNIFFCDIDKPHTFDPKTFMFVDENGEEFNAVKDPRRINGVLKYVLDNFEHKFDASEYSLEPVEGDAVSKLTYYGHPEDDNVWALVALYSAYFTYTNELILYREEQIEEMAREDAAKLAAEREAQRAAAKKEEKSKPAPNPQRKISVPEPQESPGTQVNLHRNPPESVRTFPSNGQKKYVKTKKKMFFMDRDVYQIKALVDIPAIGVKAGDLGGYIESEYNLSQKGFCWIFPNAVAMGRAQVSENATLDEHAVLRDFAKAYGNASVGGAVHMVEKSEIFDNAVAAGTCAIGGEAKIFGNANVRGDATVMDEAWVYDDAILCGTVRAIQDVFIHGYYYADYGELSGEFGSDFWMSKDEAIDEMNL